MYYLQRKEQEAGSAEQKQKKQGPKGRKKVKVFVCILSSRKLLSLTVLRVALYRGADSLGNEQKVRAEQLAMALLSFCSLSALGLLSF